MERVDIEDPYDKGFREEEFKADCAKYGLEYTPPIDTFMNKYLDKLNKMKIELENRNRQLNMKLIQLYKNEDK